MSRKIPYKTKIELFDFLAEQQQKILNISFFNNVLSLKTNQKEVRTGGFAIFRGTCIF